MNPEESEKVKIQKISSTLFQFAVRNAPTVVEDIKMLLDAGARPDFHQSRSVLMAAVNNNLPLVKLLIKHGGKVDKIKVHDIRQSALISNEVIEYIEAVQSLTM